MLTVLPNALIVGMSAALLWHLSNIWRYKTFTIQEPNIIILVAETTLLIGIFLFGAVRLVYLLRHRPD